jgi:DNA-binding MarR family transcriptional regulator
MAKLFSLLKTNKFLGPAATTYNIGLAQTQAFKFVMGITASFLKKFSLTNVEWVMLGILRDNPYGIRSLTLAETLAVEQPYVTVATRNLIRCGLITTAVDPTDKRAKILAITKKGSRLVAVVEKDLAKEMDKMAAGMLLADVAAYVKVMSVIAGKLRKTAGK